jgi:predicted DNA repair protein MutK
LQKVRGGVLGWLTYAVLSALVGVVLGAIVAVILHGVQKARGKAAH